MDEWVSSLAVPSGLPALETRLERKMKMSLKVAVCLCLFTLPLLVGCSPEPKEEPTPAPPAAGPQANAVGQPGALPQTGAKGMTPQ